MPDVSLAGRLAGHVHVIQAQEEWDTTNRLLADRAKETLLSVLEHKTGFLIDRASDNTDAGSINR